jgi:hypothetical protein
MPFHVARRERSAPRDLARLRPGSNENTFTARKETPLAILRCRPPDSRRLLQCLEAHLPKSASSLRCQFVDLRFSSGRGPADQLGVIGWHFLALFDTFWHLLSPPLGARREGAGCRRPQTTDHETTRPRDRRAEPKFDKSSLCNSEPQHLTKSLPFFTEFYRLPAFAWSEPFKFATSDLQRLHLSALFCTFLHLFAPSLGARAGKGRREKQKLGK